MVKTAVTHSVTYTLVGLLASSLLEWMRWMMGISFSVVLSFPIIGLLAGQPR